MTFDEFKTAINDIDFCDCQYGKYQLLMDGFDLIDRQRREESQAYLEQCRADPDFDLSPAAFSRSYHSA